MNELWMGVLPVAGMGLAACLLFLCSSVVRSGRAMGWLGFAATLLLGGAPVLLLWREGGRSVPAALISSDRLALFFDALFVVTAALVILLSLDYFERKRAHRAELYGLIALATTGMMVLAGATNLVTFYLGLETMSIAFYVLAAFIRTQENALEAAMKYFILGAFSSGFLLLGMGFLYGSAGSLDYGGLAAAYATGLYPLGEPFLLTGFVLFLVGVFFKLSLIPFHFWAPDVYQGAPTPLSALMAVGGKAAAAAGAVRIYLSAFTASPVLPDKWLHLFWAVGLMTIFVGSMIALTQRHIKRLLAYSSIVHAGFLALGIGALAVEPIQQAALSAVLFYLAAYLLMNVGAFAVAGAVELPEHHDENLRSFSGLGTSSPYLAALFGILMLSLAGIPLTAGFLGKFYLIGALVKGASYKVAAFAFLGAVIATFYYLKVLVTMYFPPAGDDPATPPKVSPLTLGVITLLTAAVVYLGVFPGFLNGLVRGLGIG